MAGITAPKAYDLGPLMRALLRRRPGSEEFATGMAMKILRDAKSAFNDLANAKELSDHLASHDPGKGTQKDGERVSVRGSILQHAILLCVRATETKQRRGLKIKSALSDEGKKALAEFEKLRHKAIAHFDYERPIRQNNFGDDVFVTVHMPQGGERLDLADSRVVYQTDLEKDLGKLIDEALELGAKAVVDAYADAAKRLKALSARNRDIGDMILKNPFDPVGFFGDEKLAERFLLEGAALDRPMTEMVIFEGFPDRRGFAEFNAASGPSNNGQP